jgi:RNA polymerase sigma-70 factor (ECF subfamily)
MTASASFEEFYAATVDRLLGQLFLVTGDLHVAEEIVQEAFARSLRRQTRAILKLGPPPAVPGVSVETLALVQALGTLPVRQRQAIVLHYLADLPVAEIAQALAVPGGTVKSLLARGRRALAAKLGEPEEVFDRA